jgi:hypothetical protein
MLRDPDRSLDFVSVMDGCKSFMSTAGGGVGLKGLGAGDGLLVDGTPEMVGGVVERPPGENLDGTVPARARRNTGGWNSVAVMGVDSGKPLDWGDSGMMFSRSRRDEEADVLGIEPQRPGGATGMPSST